MVFVLSPDPIWILESILGTMSTCARHAAGVGFEPRRVRIPLSHIPPHLLRTLTDEENRE